MTIAIAWLRRKKNTLELIVASDSRLRMPGPFDRAQKLYRLIRGDCCLAFCGDTAIAYTLFMQVSTALDNHIKTRTHALDVTHLSSFIGKVLNENIEIWDLDESEKAEYIKENRILFAGWSWQYKRFDIGCFVPENCKFIFHRKTRRIPHPWMESEGSFVFIGNHEREYMNELQTILAAKYPVEHDREQKVMIDFDYEPVEALHALLIKEDPDYTRSDIGGAPQMIKVYPYGNSLPFVVRMDNMSHYLLGRCLFPWEKTEYPVIDPSQRPAKVVYPMSKIPTPSVLHEHQSANRESKAEIPS